MKYVVYILYSASKDKYYIGQTQDITDRMIRHNSGRSKSTKHGIPREIVYLKEFDTRSEAMIWEKELKTKKSETFIEELIREG